jgi:hypothetical protein
VKRAAGKYGGTNEGRKLYPKDELESMMLAMDEPENRTETIKPSRIRTTRY